MKKEPWEYVGFSLSLYRGGELTRESIGFSIFGARSVGDKVETGKKQGPTGLSRIKPFSILNVR